MWAKGTEKSHQTRYTCFLTHFETGQTAVPAGSAGDSPHAGRSNRNPDEVGWHGRRHPDCLPSAPRPHV